MLPSTLFVHVLCTVGLYHAVHAYVGVGGFVCVYVRARAYVCVSICVLVNISVCV